MQTTPPLADDATVVQRVLDHIDRRTTDLGTSVWREPVENYRSQARFDAEREVLRRTPTPFCPSAALPKPGSYLARDAAGTPLLVVRGRDGRVRGFRNACRHRGTELASGAGCQQAFVCRFHGWTYGLDGRLRHVPHEHGFPGLDKAARGLVPVETVEARGLVFVTQAAPRRPVAPPDALPPLIAPEHRLIDVRDSEVPANWKILVEGFLEGYHIKSTHPDTFYPVQYDNLNVVEEFGDNNRLVFPYQAIERQRTVAPAARSAEGRLTYVYHLFPNAMVATFPGRIIAVVLDPVAIDRTRFITWALTDRDDEITEEAQAALSKGGNLIDRGGAEDREVAYAIQRSLASGANEFFEFGLFEAALGHFHRTLQAAIDAER